MPKVEDLGEVDVLVAKKQGMKASEGLVDDITIPIFYRSMIYRGISIVNVEELSSPILTALRYHLMPRRVVLYKPFQ